MSIRVFLWRKLVRFYPWYLRKVYKMDIGKNVQISWKAHLDKSVNPKGIHIGDESQVLNGAMILSHDACRRLKADTRIGKNCVIGVRSIILPGVTIGDSVLIGAGSIVTHNIPNNCSVAGNPAKIVRTGVVLRKRIIIEKGFRVV